MRVSWIFLVMMAQILAGCITTGADTAPAENIEVDEPLHFVTSTSTSNPDHVDMLSTAIGTYRFTGWSTFEPTIGATPSGALFTNSYRGTEFDMGPGGFQGGGAQILRSSDQGMTWEDVTPVLPTGMKLVPNSHDPYIYVDPFTGDLYDFEMCVLLTAFCMTVSEDEGETWTQRGIVTGWQPALLDHQSLASTPLDDPPAGATHDVGLVFCVNRVLQAAGSWCSSSFDDGITWTPLAPGYPTDQPQCAGLHGHLVGSTDGYIYRGSPDCNNRPAVYRSGDGGLTWTQHTVSTMDSHLLLDHEVSTAVDDEGNVYAFWISRNGLPHLAASTDHGETWTTPRMVGAPNVTAAGFPSIAAGAAGRLAWTYIGTEVPLGYDGEEDEMTWSGYIGLSVDFLGDDAFANIPVNTPEDPLDSGRPCGAMRCGGFGDFVDITIDPDGRPWAALAHNRHDDAGIVGTLSEGPSLRHEGLLPDL